MTNWERYKGEIINFKPKEDEMNGDGRFCSRFIKPKVLEPAGKECISLVCSQCYILMLTWLMDEYKEPETDWSKVPVDTKIYVKSYEEDDEWYPRYFAKYENGKVYAWQAGGTSWSSEPEEVTDWKYVKLAEVDDD